MAFDFKSKIKNVKALKILNNLLLTEEIVEEYES